MFNACVNYCNDCNLRYVTSAIRKNVKQYRVALAILLFMIVGVTVKFR